MLVYILFKFPRNTLLFTFMLTIVGLIGWQISDSILRIVDTLEAATKWHYAFLPAVLLVTSAGLHFTLLFTNTIKKRNFLVPLLIYLPMVAYDLLNKVRIVKIPVEQSEMWGYVQSQDINLVGVVEFGHVILYAFLIIFFLSRFALKIRSERLIFQQTILILIGFLIPTIQGSITQFVFPHVMGIGEIPITSSSMSAFTIAILIALNRYQLFSFEPEYEAEKILSTMNDGLCAVDNSNKIRYTNNRMKELFGYSESTLLNTDLYDYLHPANYQQEVDHIMLNRTVGKPHEYYLRFLTKDGNTLFTHVRDKPILNYRDNITGWINVITDITQLEQALLNLKNKNKELSTFFHRTSHDLRGPLTSIMGLISISQNKSQQQPEIIQLLKMMEEKSAELDKILGKLINIAEINDTEPTAKEVNIDQLVGEVAQDVIIDFPDKECEFKKQFEFNTITTDRYFLKAIFYSLLSNAITFNENNPVKIKLSGYYEENQYKLEVADNGTGIPAEMEDNIFDMFIKGDREKGGSGLGLYLVKIALDKINGTIDYTSTSNGTRFSIVLNDYNQSISGNVIT